MDTSRLAQVLQAAMSRPNGRFVGPRPEQTILAAERALGFRFPHGYRMFVESLGAGSVGGFEVYGVISDDFTNSSIPDAVWLTLDERRTGLPANLLVIGSTGDGNYYVIDVSIKREDEDAEVYEWDPGDGTAIGRRSVPFGDYLSEGIRHG